MSKHISKKKNKTKNSPCTRPGQNCWFSWLRSSQKHIIRREFLAKSNRGFPPWPHDGARTSLTVSSGAGVEGEAGSPREGAPVQGMESLTGLREPVSGPHWLYGGHCGSFRGASLALLILWPSATPSKGPGERFCFNSVILSCALGNYETKIKTPWNFAIGEGCHLLPKWGLTGDIWKRR